MIVWVRNGEYFSVSSTVPNNPTVYTPVEPSVAKHQQIYLTVPFSHTTYANILLPRWYYSDETGFPDIHDTYIGYTTLYKKLN